MKAWGAYGEANNPRHGRKGLKRSTEYLFAHIVSLTGHRRCATSLLTMIGVPHGKYNQSTVRELESAVSSQKKKENLRRSITSLL